VVGVGYLEDGHAPHLGTPQPAVGHSRRGIGCQAGDEPERTCEVETDLPSLFSLQFAGLSKGHVIERLYGLSCWSRRRIRFAQSGPYRLLRAASLLQSLASWAVWNWISILIVYLTGTGTFWYSSA
jgi:hypothetical protein